MATTQGIKTEMPRPIEDRFFVTDTVDAPAPAWKGGGTETHTVSLMARPGFGFVSRLHSNHGGAVEKPAADADSLRDCWSHMPAEVGAKLVSMIAAAEAHGDSEAPAVGLAQVANADRFDWDTATDDEMADAGLGN